MERGTRMKYGEGGPALADLHPTAVPTKTHAYNGVLTWRTSVEYERIAKWWSYLSPGQRAFRIARQEAVNNLLAVHSFEVCLWDIYSRAHAPSSPRKGWIVHRMSALYDRDHVICIPKDASLAYWIKAAAWLDTYS